MINIFKKLKKAIKPKKKNKKKSYITKQVAIPYFMVTLLAMAGHSLVANLGGLEYVFPNMPAPIAFQDGRAVHLNLSVFWPIFGLIGGVLYFLPEEAETELYSPLLAILQLGLMIIIGMGIVITLSLGITEGKEYLEAIKPFDIAILVILALFSFNVIKTIIKSKHKTNRPTLVLMAFGLILMFFLFIPTTFFWGSIILEEIFRWWVVHLWVETSIQLIAAAVIAAFLIYITSVNRKVIYFWLYIEAIIVMAVGFFATGHHYLWIGTPSFWFTLGGVFGALQSIPIFIIAYTAYKSVATGIPVKHHRWPLYLIFNSVFWNILGAAIFGMIITIPSINLYTHGTLITSAHAHLALFGTFGFLAIAVSYFGVLEWVGDKYINKTWSLISIILLNLGLIIMGIALILGGMVQIYLIKIMGVEFGQSLHYLTPYMMVRSIGGGLFAVGGLLFAGHLFYGIYQAKPSSKILKNVITMTVKNKIKNNQGSPKNNKNQKTKDKKQNNNDKAVKTVQKSQLTLSKEKSMTGVKYSIKE